MLHGHFYCQLLIFAAFWCLILAHTPHFVFENIVTSGDSWADCSNWDKLSDSQTVHCLRMYWTCLYGYWRDYCILLDMFSSILVCTQWLRMLYIHLWKVNTVSTYLLIILIQMFFTLTYYLQPPTGSPWLRWDLQTEHLQPTPCSTAAAAPGTPGASGTEPPPWPTSLQ